MTFLVNYENRDYLLDIEDMNTDDARAMERFGVKNLMAFENGIGEGDVDALTIAYWLMLKQNGEPGARLEHVRFKPIKFLKALGKAAQTEAEQAAEGDEPEGKDEA